MDVSALLDVQIEEEPDLVVPVIKVEKDDWETEPRIPVIKQEADEQGDDYSSAVIRPDELVRIKEEPIEEYVGNGLDYIGQPCSSKESQKLLGKGAQKVVKKKKFPCPICRKNFPTPISRQKHVYSHFGKHGLICFCGQHFFNKDEYFSHRLIHYVKKANCDPPIDSILNVLSVENAFICQICQITFTSQHHLENHQTLHHENSFNGNLSDIPDHFSLSSSDNPYPLGFDKSTVPNKQVSRSHSQKFECQICRRQFSQEFGLKLHLNTHLGIVPFTCSLCNNVYKSKHILRIHLRNHHKLSDYKRICKPCNKIFGCRSDFMKHVSAFHRQQKSEKEAPFKCTHCPKSFVAEIGLKRHLDKYNFTASCKFCDISVKTPHFLRKHLNVHVEKPFICQICFRRFTTPKSFKGHLISEQRKDSDDIVMKCEICPQRFFKSQSLTRHMRMTHHQEKSESVKAKKEDFIPNFEEIKCDACSKHFWSKNSLRIHIRDVHDVTEADRREIESFQCDYCPKMFDNRRAYNVHTRNHVYKIKCVLCETILDNLQQLMKHLDNHIDEKPYSCQVCSRKFDYRKDFQRHLVAECKGTEETLFDCPICSLHYYHRTFVTKHLVNEHRPDYSDIDGNGAKHEMHKCNLCERVYKTEEKLRVHEKTHEYRESCVYCKETFHAPSDLSAHLNTHVGERPYKCVLCSNEFSSMRKFRSHLKCEQRRLTHENFKCQLCLASFYQKSSLTKHVLKTHQQRRNTVVGAPHLTEDDALFKCHVCQKLYIDEDQYARHIKRHEYFDKCKVCFKEFTSRCRLMKHLDEHIVKPFNCPLCKRTFDAKKCLKDHLVMEQAKNSHRMVMRCDICEFNYYHKASFNRHMKIEHDAYPQFGPVSTMPLEDSAMEEFDVKIEIKEESVELQNFQ